VQSLGTPLMAILLSIYPYLSLPKSLPYLTILLSIWLYTNSVPSRKMGMAADQGAVYSWACIHAHFI